MSEVRQADDPQALLNAINAVATRVGGLEQELRAVGSLAVLSAEKSGVLPPPEEGAEDVRPVDLPWKCERCRAVLGYCDDERDEVRIRRSDLFVWVQLGPASSVTVGCRSCGHRSTVSYRPSAHLQADEVDGEVLLTVAELKQLLRAAQESARGAIPLRIVRAGDGG